MPFRGIAMEKHGTTSHTKDTKHFFGICYLDVVEPLTHGRIHGTTPTHTS